METLIHSTLRWFGHLEKVGKSDEMMRRIFKSGIDAVGIRGQTLVKMGG